MNKGLIKAIGIQEVSRKDAILSNISDAQGLTDILNKQFEVWSNFDSWESISSQQWIFVRALDVYKGKKLDIKCNCCEFINFNLDVFKRINNIKCNGIKSVYMIEKVFDEIVLAKAIRENDGTYTA